MAAIDDLKKSVSDLSASIGKEIEAIAAKLSQPTNEDADIENAVSALNALKETLDKETASLTQSSSSPSASSSLSV